MSNPPSDIYKQLFGDPQALTQEQRAILDSIPIRGAAADALSADKPVAQRYSVDADPDGIRALVADAIHGALAFGFQGVKPPPEGHWLTMFWQMGRDALAAQPAAEPSGWMLWRETTGWLFSSAAATRDECLQNIEAALKAENLPTNDWATYGFELRPFNAAQPARAGGDAPQVPNHIIQAITAYGDARADQDASALAATFPAVIRMLRAEFAALAAAPQPANLVNDSFAIDWLTSRAELHPETARLVVRFARALAQKLAAVEKKYGYSDGWMSPDWMDECRTKLMEHVAKGDPRDVAAYSAFLWHHGASTAAPQPAASEPAATTGMTRHGLPLRVDVTKPCPYCPCDAYHMCGHVDFAARIEQPAASTVPAGWTDDQMMRFAAYARTGILAGLSDEERLGVFRQDEEKRGIAAPAAVERQPLPEAECIKLLKFGQSSVEMVRRVERAHGIGSSKEGGSSSTGGGE